MKSDGIPGRKRPVVLVSTPTYLPIEGGASTFFSTLISQLEDEVDFVVYTMRLPGEPIIERRKNCLILRIQPNLIDSPTPLRLLVVPPATTVTLLALWLRFRPKVLHAHSNGVFGFSASIFSTLFHRPMIKEVQDLSDPPSNLRMGHVRSWGAIGTTIRDKIISCDIPRSRVRTFPSMLPPDDQRLLKDIKPRPLGSKKPFELLCVAALRPYKGVDVLLRAFSIIESKRDDVHLTIIGDGGERETLEEYIKSKGLKKVDMVGNVDRATYLKKYLARSDCLVLASRSAEGNPFVILESFQLGRAVVATRVGGIPEMIKDGKNGLLVRPEDPEAFAKAVLRVVEDRELLHNLARGGKRFLELQPKWEDLVEVVFEEYMQ